MLVPGLVSNRGEVAEVPIKMCSKEDMLMGRVGFSNVKAKSRSSIGT